MLICHVTEMPLWRMPVDCFGDEIPAIRASPCSERWLVYSNCTLVGYMIALLILTLIDNGHFFTCRYHLPILTGTRTSDKCNLLHYYKSKPNFNCIVTPQCWCFTVPFWLCFCVCFVDIHVQYSQNFVYHVNTIVMFKFKQRKKLVFFL